MMTVILGLPFNQVKFQIRAFEMLGDFFYYFKDYKLALLYYIKGVIHINL